MRLDHRLVEKGRLEGGMGLLKGVLDLAPKEILVDELVVLTNECSHDGLHSPLTSPILKGENRGTKKGPKMASERGNEGQFQVVLLDIAFGQSYLLRRQ